MISARPGPTLILAVRRIACELLNESGRYQTTPGFKLEQVTMNNEQILRSILESIREAKKNIDNDCLLDVTANLEDIRTMTCILLGRAGSKPKQVTPQRAARGRKS